MSRTTRATRRIASAARRLLPRVRRTTSSGRRDQQGFICAFVRGRWCTARYEAGFSAVNLVLGATSTCARRLQGLPSRFEALFLLCKLMNRGATA